MSEVTARPGEGTPCWVSLLVRDLPAAQAFYGGLFGWEFRPGPQRLGPYTRAMLGSREIAGVGQVPEGRRLPVTWTTYLASDNADVTAERIRESGGTVAVGPLEVDSAGRMAIASDPGGTVFGIWEARGSTGTGHTGQPGSLAWNELVTRDAAWVDAFYRAVFGFTAEEVPAPFDRRVLLHLGGRPVAGISAVGERFPHGRAPYWMTYFAVAGADDAVRRAKELGGTVLRECRDSPYGRQAVLADPEGARFSVVEAPAPTARHGGDGAPS